MKRLARGAFLLLFSTVLTQPAWSLTDEDQLEARLRQADVPAKSTPIDDQTWREAATSAKSLLAENVEEADKCQETEMINLAEKYAIGWDKTSGRPCRLYDLSFPTLKTLTGSIRVSQLPIQRLTSRDYLNWIDGNYSAVIKNVSNFQETFDPRSLSSSWVAQLKFKPQNAVAMNVNMAAGAEPLQSFRASDLDVGSRFRFNSKDTVRLKGLMAAVRTMRPSVNAMPLQPDIEQFWQNVVDRPELLLEHIRFEWNDTDKAYSVLVDGSFLPFSGPIALVDYQAPYRQALERVIRSVLSAALRGVAQFIPNLMVRNVIRIAVTDTFEFVDLMYDYQANQLEDTLRASLNGTIKTDIDEKTLLSSLNIIFGARSNLVTQYIMTTVQRQKFDWQQIEKIGANSRYQEEKARDIRLNNLHSRLVLKGRCDISIVHGHFGVCSRDGQAKSLHSFMSEPSVLFWKLGAPMIHRFGFGSEVLLKRTTAWTLSVGVRLFDLPLLPKFLRYTLGNALKDFATAGLLDEAYLRNHYSLLKMKGEKIDSSTEVVVDWLYRQSLNPFLPKSVKAENRVININKNILKLNSNVPNQAL